MAVITRRILLVDDEPGVRNALRRMLTREGYVVEVASCGEGALEVLAAQAFDLVLSDHLMPEMNGLELLRQVRDRHPDCLRVMLTGHADLRVAIDAINDGAIYRFLTKPWDDVELKVTLTLAFEQLDLLRENRRLLSQVRELERQSRVTEVAR